MATFTHIYDTCIPWAHNDHALGQNISQVNHDGYSLFSVPQKSQPYNHIRTGYIPIVPKLSSGVLQPIQYQSSPFLGQIYPNYVAAQLGATP